MRDDIVFKITSLFHMKVIGIGLDYIEESLDFKDIDGTNSNLGEIEVLSITREGIHGLSEHKEVEGLVSLNFWELEEGKTEISFNNGKTWINLKEVQNIVNN